MTNNNNMIKLSNVRLIYPAIIEPKVWEQVGQPPSQPTYSSTFILDKVKNLKDILAINKLTDEILLGMKTSREIVKEQSGSKNLPLKDGDITDKEDFKNSFTIRASSLYKPQAFLKDGVTKTVDDKVFYSGCYVNSYIELLGYNKPCFGVKARFLGIQFYKSGEAISGGVNLSGIFESVEDEESDDINIPF